MNTPFRTTTFGLIFSVLAALASSACGVDSRPLSEGEMGGGDAGTDARATGSATGGKGGASGAGGGATGTATSTGGAAGAAGAGTGGGGTGGGTPGGVCRDGELRCTATGVPQKCNAAGTAFDDQPACQGEALCDDATGMCASRCMSGAKRCKPGAAVTQQCDLQGVWQDTSTCPFACGGTGAMTACTGTCVPGTRTCGANNTPFLCDATGTNQMQTACTSACTGDGECTGDCKPNATRCAAGSTTRVETCGATGTWGASTACTFVCDTATQNCGGECVPGTANRCSGSTIQSCDATGHWKDMMSCGTTPCSMGQCRACTPAQKQCNASKPQTCTAAGNWMDDQATACPFVCDAASGRCAGECVPGADACMGNSTKHCGANGLYAAATACPNICDTATGRCGGVCVPGARRCNGSSAQTCGANGQWGSDMPCQYGCAAATGLCNTCTDEAMATTCSGGKCGPTMNNCAHTVQCSTTCPGTGATCGGGGVTGICGCSPQSSGTTCSGKCGNVLNNCGTTVACSSACPSMQTCGGGGTPNVCGCTPEAMATTCSGKCGNVANNCGQTVACSSTCPANQTCGGGGTPNVCGCTAQSMATTCSGKCGNVINNCGQTVACSSTCPANQTCGGGGTPNVCGCTPDPMGTTCSGKCGNVTNNCGTTVACSSACPSMQTCGGGGTPNVCGCTPESNATFCSRLGKVCGAFSGTDNCGAARNVGSCGTCNAMQTCSANACQCLSSYTGPNCATPRFEGIGPTLDSNFPVGVSADGTAAAITAYDINEIYTGYIWKVPSTLTMLMAVSAPRQGSVEPKGISANGAAIAGNFDTSPLRGFKWTAAGNAAELSILSGGTSSYGNGTNSDGTVIVGSSSKADGQLHPVRWVNGAISELPVFSVGTANIGSASDVSDDGNVVVGGTKDAFDRTKAFRWTVGTPQPQDLGALSGASESHADAVSANGAVVVGSSNLAAFRWSSGSGMTAIPNGLLGASSYPNGVNQDGTVIVGGSTNGAWVWDPNVGTRLLSAVLDAAGISYAGWDLSKGWTQAMGVSANGKIIVGSGIAPSGVTRSFIVRLP